MKKWSKDLIAQGLREMKYSYELLQETMPMQPGVMPQGDLMSRLKQAAAQHLQPDSIKQRK